MLANKLKIPVIPYSTGINVRGLTIPVHDGSILLDLSRMNRILEINPEMKTATVEPGVTFGMLLEQTRKHKLRPAFPYAPLTVSVLVNYYLRGIYQTSATDGHDHTISYEMILDPIYSFHGQLCYFELDVFYDGSDPGFGEKLRNYNDKQFHRLLELGIYGWFRLYAGIIEPTAERIGYLAEVWNKFLHVLDPNEIMNRGELF